MGIRRTAKLKGYEYFKVLLSPAQMSWLEVRRDGSGESKAYWVRRCIQDAISGGLR
jgi:hypothetical protein